MTSLVPVRGNSALVRPRGLASKDRVQIERSAAARAYRVQAASVVGQLAAQEASSLSALEGRLITMTPLAEDRLRLIVDTTVGVMATHIARMANE
jgi:hypothetical protein